MGYLLDTDVAIHLRDGDPAARLQLLTLEEVPFLSAVTRVELEGGIHARPDLSDKRRRAVDVLLSEFEVLDFNSDTTEAYGKIVEHAGFSRRKVTDRMIAATAMVHALTLVTMNGRDFRDVPGLELLEWEQAGH